MATLPEEQLSFEADFTRRLFSLFGSLFDPRASPFMGPVPVTEGEEEEQDDIPTFDSSLCDYRLRAVYNAEVEARKTTNEDLAAKSEQIIDNSQNPEQIVLGDPLPPRSASGRTSDAELARQRRENDIRRQKAAEQRRQRQIARKEKELQEQKERDRKDYQSDMDLIKKTRQQEFQHNKAKADVLREKMRIRREAEEERRQIDMQRQEEAAQTIKSISYHSQVADKVDIRKNKKEQEESKKRAIQARKEAEKKTLEHNRQNAMKPSKSEAIRNSNRLPLD